MARIIIGCERFGHIRDAFRATGHDAISVDLLPSERPGPHHQGDVLAYLEQFPDDWFDLGIFHPVCTYLTSSAEWAYKDPDYSRYPGVGYHQRVKPETLTGAKRREARIEALDFVMSLWRCSKVKRCVIENPVGIISRHLGRATQTIHPHEYGHDASKATCLWIRGNLPPLQPTRKIEPRYVDGKPRWGNQTDSGQNNLTPSANRAALRGETYPGWASAMADQWGPVLDKSNKSDLFEGMSQ